MQRGHPLQRRAGWLRMMQIGFLRIFGSLGAILFGEKPRLYEWETFLELKSLSDAKVHRTFAKCKWAQKIFSEFIKKYFLGRLKFRHYVGVWSEKIRKFLNPVNKQSEIIGDPVRAMGTKPLGTRKYNCRHIFLCNYCSRAFVRNYWPNFRAIRCARFGYSIMLFLNFSDQNLSASVSIYFIGK